MCDKAVDMCGENNDHICLHGAKCIKNEDGTHGCDCTKANGASSFDKFAGLFCEHKASMFCTADGSPGTGSDHASFCVNGGKCKGTSKGNGHPGCDCGPLYTGDHCQFMEKNTEHGFQTMDSKKSKGPGVFLGVFLSLAIVAGIAGYVYIRRKRSAKEIDTGATSGKHTFTLGCDTERTEDEMKNVEII